MNWKNWPYWLKGGVALLVIGVVCMIIAYFGDLSEGGSIDWLMVLLTLPFAFSAFFMGATGVSLLIGIVQQSLLYFAAGSLFGWIYGKFKK
jgi:hypothetical protein